MKLSSFIRNYKNLKMQWEQIMIIIKRIRSESGFDAVK